MKKEDKQGLYFLAETPVEFFTSGCTLLDCSLGGGYPERRIINLIGDTSVGKSLLASEAAINFLKKYPKGKVYYLEAEAAFDKRYAELVGLPLIDKKDTSSTKAVGKVTFIEDVDTVEGMYNKLSEISGIDDSEIDKEKGNEDSIKVDIKKQAALFIVDSLDALGDSAEKGREIDEGSYGTKAKQLSSLFRRLTKKIAKANITLFIISQIRDNIGVTFGNKDTTSGGRALEFYASQRIWLANLGKLEKTIGGEKRFIGLKVKSNCKKNKVGLPFRVCEFPIIFNFGIDDVLAHLQYLESIKKLDSIKSELDLKGRALIDIANNIRGEKNSVELQDSLKELVIHFWNEIENQFIPKFKKY